MASEVNIIGLGETAKQFNGKGITIGVNDAAHKWGLELDYLVLQDNPTNFTFERYQNIIDNPPKEKVYSNQLEWRKSFKKGIWSLHPLQISLDSTFFALQIAIHLEFKTINIFGADFYHHPQLGQKIPQIIEQYNKYFLGKEDLFKIRVPKQSALSQCQNVTLID